MYISGARDLAVLYNLLSIVRRNLLNLVRTSYRLIWPSHAADLTPGVHESVGQIRPPNMFWTLPGPPEDDPAWAKSISKL